MQQLTEAEAWRTIGEAFEARAAHPELSEDVSLESDLAADGMCGSLDKLDALDGEMHDRMDDKIMAEVESPQNPGTLYFTPFTSQPGGAELRATLAYLFAEEVGA